MGQAYGTGIAAKEHKDRKKDLDKNPLKRRELEREPKLITVIPRSPLALFLRIFFCAFCTFLRRVFFAMFAFFRGYPCLCLILASLGFIPGYIALKWRETGDLR